MPAPDLITRVLNAVIALQTSHERDVSSINPNTRPVGDLDEFDSHNGLELTCSLAADYGIDVPEDENIFLDEDNRPLSIKEIAERLGNLITEKVE